MNDFTKEELVSMLEALRIIDADPSIKPEIYWPDSLRYKIQSMIDNYCEHDMEYAGYVEMGICKHCGWIGK